MRAQSTMHAHTHTHTNVRAYTARMTRVEKRLLLTSAQVGLPSLIVLAAAVLAAGVALLSYKLFWRGSRETDKNGQGQVVTAPFPSLSSKKNWRLWSNGFWGSFLDNRSGAGTIDQDHARVSRNSCSCMCSPALQFELRKNPWCFAWTSHLGATREDQGSRE